MAAEQPRPVRLPLECEAGWRRGATSRLRRVGLTSRGRPLHHPCLVSLLRRQPDGPPPSRARPSHLDHSPIPRRPPPTSDTSQRHSGRGRPLWRDGSCWQSLWQSTGHHGAGFGGTHRTAHPTCPGRTAGDNSRRTRRDRLRIRRLGVRIPPSALNRCPGLKRSDAPMTASRAFGIEMTSGSNAVQVVSSG